jgi:signal transduction histidine kinase
MMIVVSGLTAVGVYFGDRSIIATAQRDLQGDFSNQIVALQQLEQQRRAVLAERCRTLVTKPRLHAALEDNALDLLYPTAKDELRELMGGGSAAGNDRLHAQFYRFLDTTGSVIRPPDEDAGTLSSDEEKQLALSSLPSVEQIGYLVREDGRAADAIDEVFTAPILSTDTGEVISALVAGFPTAAVGSDHSGTRMLGGIWLRDHLWLPALDRRARSAIESRLRALIGGSPGQQGSFSANFDGEESIVFYTQLNSGSAFAPAYEVCVYPLSEFAARQRKLRLATITGGAVLLLIGVIASHLAATRLAKPVQQLAAQTEAERTHRKRAETVLASTSVELQRSARFSADASHQLKSPVAVLRAGIESLLARPDLAPEVYDELSSLLHQTYRLTGVVDDLLLLSRMDAGRLEIESRPLDFNQLLDDWLDDLTALPDTLPVEIETDVPRGLAILGEKPYVGLIVQNLLENARKYNRPGGTIRVTAREGNGMVTLKVANTGHAIPPQAQERIFERFHRGSVGEDVPGHGLGLNLARELARLHGGELRLVTSTEDWTEFAVSFRAAVSSAAVVA